MKWIVLHSMPVGQMPEWLVLEKRIEQFKDLIHDYMERDLCVPTEINTEYNKLIEQQKNLQKRLREAEAANKASNNTVKAPKESSVAGYTPSFKERVLNILEGRIECCIEEELGILLYNNLVNLHKLVNTMAE